MILAGALGAGPGFSHAIAAGPDEPESARTAITRLIQTAGATQEEMGRLRLLRELEGRFDLEAALRADLVKLLPVVDDWADGKSRMIVDTSRAAEHGYLRRFITSRVRPAAAESDCALAPLAAIHLLGLDCRTRSMTRITRVIIDECVGDQSALMQRFRQTLAPGQPVEFVRLADVHRAIPDVELLRRLLGPETILLTMDRVLHNQVCQLGFRSYTMDAQGNLRRKKLPGIPTVKPVVVHSSVGLKSDYLHPANPLAQALKQGMTERDFKRYKTRRRRIRSYFGSEANIASVALTIGAKVTARGSLCGYFLRLAGKSGVKGLGASEGYSLSSAAEWNPAWCVIHGLRELYLLQLETIPTQVYIIPPASLSLCGRLFEAPDCSRETGDARALHRLLKGLTSVGVFPCAKGPFFDRMERKLQQLARFSSNELVAVDFALLITALDGAPASS